MNSDYKIVRRVTLTEKHCSTGRTRHYRNGQLLSLPARLEIVQYNNDPGFYLFYIDSRNEISTDTYHDTLEAGLVQAEWEFGVELSDWEILTG
jgi:hypothetical protein